MTIPTRTANRLKALILILMAIFFAQKFVSGTLYYYIGPRFGWLSLVAIVLFIVLAGAYNLVGQAETHDHEHDHHHIHADHDHEHDHGQVSIWTLLIIALPLLLGVIIPAEPLNASAAGNRGITITGIAVSDEGSATVLSIVPAERNLLDWARAMSTNPAPDALNGQEADVSGFVYRDIRFADDQFMVGRFTISCCVADALAIGVVIQYPDAVDFPTDSWVRVRGTFSSGTLAGESSPILIPDEIIPIEPPEQPYLFQ